VSDAGGRGAESGRRVGRTAGSPPNREAILGAARQQFARRGYQEATIRDIAREAGVDPALVHHYFGSKDALFAAALRLPFRPAELVAELLAGGVEGLGERIVRRFLAIWSNESAGGAFAGLLRSAAGHEDAARMLREFFTDEVMERIVASLDMPQARLRAALVASQIVGLAWMRLLLRLEPIASVDAETLVACCAPTLQRYLTGSLAGD
jgi:AcrR family transcriptional regulator